MLDAVIIGAGFSGLYQLYCLRETHGLNVRVLEAGDGVGGTWYWNRYPGARCDSESHVYCYTFSPELSEYWNWTERYPSAEEVVRYLNHVADRFDLRRSIQFGTCVVAARFDEQDSCWDIDVDTGQTYRARFLITAVGCLSSASIPEIAGMDDFAGEHYHTGRWPHEGVHFDGKRVGQIGTGSTGIQCVPVIAGTARHLTVFQRTANYSVPARNHILSKDQRDACKRDAQAIRELTRSNGNGHGWRIRQQKALEASADERSAIYEKAWKTGGLRFRSTFSDLLSSQEANATAAEFICEKIRQLVRDPATAAALADIDHPYAAKRPPIDTQYFETFNLENVTLIDLKKTPIVKVVEDGIVCRGADEEIHHPLDMIVFATGYDAITGTLLRMDIRGRSGLTLHEAWKNGPHNYLGLQVAGFPNLFTVTGPGSPCVLTNMPSAIEQHVEWISDCIAYLAEHNHTTIECSSSSADSWVAQVNAEANKTLLPRVRHSWYLGANIPGKPKMFMPYAGGLDKYRAICAKEAQNNYSSFIIV